MPHPILYSFRRCPYAMRARLALVASGITTELREIVLRDKAPEFLEASAKGTVPVLQTEERVIDESLDIMLWALEQNDPDILLSHRAASLALVETFDTNFKPILDRTKYAHRHSSDPEQERENAQPFLETLALLLGKNIHLLAPHPVLADIAIFPFIRQFANIDRTRFDSDAPATLINWLDHHLASRRFAKIMDKYPKWQSGDDRILFPSP